MKLVLLILSSYLIGSISFSIIICYIFKGIDIRTQGSGNAGATNVKRILGFKFGALVMVLDFLKAFIPIILVSRLDINFNSELVKILALFSIIIGHIFPIFFSFKGGKGVASAAGGITALFPPTFPFSLTVFIVSYKISKHVSLASIISAITLHIFYYVYMEITNNEISYILLLFFILLTSTILLSHRSNIKRLFKGTEF